MFSSIFYFTANGVDAESVLEQRRLAALEEIDLNDAAHNSTVREYEQVNVSTSNDDNASAPSGEGSATKKSRKN